MNSLVKGLWWSPALLLLLTTLFWGGNTVVGKFAVERISGIELSFWRWVLALLLLFPFAWRRLRADLPVYRRQWRLMLLLGLLSVSAYNTLQYLALHWTQAINVGVVSATMPLAVFLLNWMLGRERADGYQRAGMLLAFGGVLVVISRGDPAQLLGLDFNRGDLLMLLAVASFALYSVWLRKLPHGIDQLGLLLALVIIGVIGIFPFYLWDLGQSRPATWDGVTLLVLAYVGLFPSILSYLFWSRAVFLGGSNMAALFINMIAVYSTLLAMLLLGEQLAFYHLLGMAGIFLGICLATVIRARA